MLKLKTRWFNKWANKNKITDEDLLVTLNDLSEKSGVTDLGAGLYKVRTRRRGRGKCSGFRTIVVFKESSIAIFVYGFSKNEKSNLDKEELKYFKKLSKNLLSIRIQEFIQPEGSGDFIRIKE